MIGRNAYQDEEPDYLSYLLRLWCVEGDSGRVWRASLQSIRTRQQVAFAGLEALFEYLRAQTGVEAAQDLGGLPRPPRSMNRKGKEVPTRIQWILNQQICRKIGGKNEKEYMCDSDGSPVDPAGGFAPGKDAGSG